MGRLLLGHRLFDQADDGHQRAAAHAAGGDRADDAGQVRPARAGRQAEHRQYLSAEPAAQDAADRVAQHAEIEFFQQSPRDISADRAGDE
jgi:hypothetical protein